MLTKKKTSYKLYLSLLLLSSCGESSHDWKDRVSPTPYDIPSKEEFDLEIQDIITLFREDANTHQVDVTEGFERLKAARFNDEDFNDNNDNDRAVGRCYNVSDFRGRPLYSRLYIKTSWKNQKGKPYSFKGLVYHELGHCILGLDHSTYQGIMFPSLSTESFYKSNWPDLVNGLFSKN